jgi:phosphoribosylformylglycinamidine cyclo-ligase
MSRADRDKPDARAPSSSDPSPGSAGIVSERPRGAGGSAVPADAYSAAGVDYSVMDPGKLLAQRAAADTARWLAARGASEVAASRGESAYVIELPDRYLSFVTEALGTKNLVADATRSVTGRTHYDAIARDTVATILNDLSSVGGQPLALTAYWGAGSSAWFDDAERMRDLTLGWAAACDEAGCAWGGGETQAIGGVVAPGAMVLGGSAIGSIAPKSDLLLGSKLQAGDAILIAKASGIHANGLSLARKLAAGLAGGYATRVPDDPGGRGLGEVLLDPTPLYGRLVETLQREGIALHYAAHITGHGWRKLMRASEAFSYVVERIPEVPPGLRYLQQLASLSDEEAYGTFNMGAGYALFVAEKDVTAAQELATKLGQPLLRAGHLEQGTRRVLIRPLGIEYQGSALQIR